MRVLAPRQYALDHAPLEPCRPARLALQALAHGFDRFPESRIGRGRQLCRDRTARAIRRCRDRATARQRAAPACRSSSAKASSNNPILPDSSARRMRPAVSCPAGTEVADQRTKFALRRVRGDGDGCLLARFARDAMGVVDVQPRPPGDKAGQRLGQLGDQSLPRSGGNIVAFKQRFADRREMTETLDDAIDGKRRDVGIAVFDQQQTGFRACRLRQSRRRPSTAMRPGSQSTPGSWLRPSRPHRPDQRRRRAATAHRPARRSAADRPRARATIAGGALGLAASTSASARRTSGDGSSSSISIAPSAAARSSERQIGIKIGARQSTGCLGPFTGRCGAHPVQEIADDHGVLHATRNSEPDLMLASASLIKRSP